MVSNQEVPDSNEYLSSWVEYKNFVIVNGTWTGPVSNTVPISGIPRNIWRYSPVLSFYSNLFFPTSLNIDKIPRNLSGSHLDTQIHTYLGTNLDKWETVQSLSLYRTRVLETSSVKTYDTNFWSISVTSSMRLVVETVLSLECTIFRSVPQVLPSPSTMLYLNVVVYCPEYLWQQWWGHRGQVKKDPGTLMCLSTQCQCLRVSSPGDNPWRWLSIVRSTSEDRRRYPFTNDGV